MKSSEKIILVEGEDIINEDGENVEILDTFFSNAVNNLKIPEYQNIRKQTPLLTIFLIQYLRRFRNTEIIQTLLPLKI